MILKFLLLLSGVLAGSALSTDASNITCPLVETVAMQEKCSPILDSSNQTQFVQLCSVVNETEVEEKIEQVCPPTATQNCTQVMEEIVERQCVKNYEKLCSHYQLKITLKIVRKTICKLVPECKDSDYGDEPIGFRRFIFGLDYLPECHPVRVCRNISVPLRKPVLQKVCYFWPKERCKDVHDEVPKKVCRPSNEKPPCMNITKKVPVTKPVEKCENIIQEKCEIVAEKVQIRKCDQNETMTAIPSPIRPLGLE